MRELDERLGFGELIERHLTDARGKNTQLPLTDLVRQSVYSRLAGYEDVNDAERLSQDPAFRLIGSEKVLERGAALTSRLQSFETELLTQRRKPCRSGADQPRLDRQGGGHRFGPPRGAGHGQHRGPGLRPTGAKRLQRTLRVHLLPPAAVVQPRRRLPGGETAPGQRPQRRGLGGTAAARDRAPTAAGQGGGLSCRRGLRQAGDLRGAGRTRGEVRHPPSGQRQSGAQGCAVAEAASGKAELQAGGSVQEPSSIRRPVGRERGG